MQSDCLICFTDICTGLFMAEKALECYKLCFSNDLSVVW